VLRELRIENLLVIERAELRFEDGFTVLTGETGAGKTVLAHSLDLLGGGKARKGIVRPGASEAWVEGVFDLPPDWREADDLAEIRERLPEEAEELVLGRRVSSGGRPSAFIGGRSATAGELRLLAERLVSFYGQHEHRQLTIASTQMAVLDSAGGPALETVFDHYRAGWAELREAEAELASVTDSGGVRDLDLLRFELDEIDAAGLDPAEKQALDVERARLRHVEALRTAADSAADLTRGTGGSEGIADAAARAAGLLGAETGKDGDLDRLAERMESVSVELGDIAVELSAYLQGLEADPDRLREVEERLDLIARLELKHGGSVEAVLAHADACRVRIADLEGGAERERELAERVRSTREKLETTARKLTAAREVAARSLASGISGDLEELAMKGAALEVELVPLVEGPGPFGAESVEFMFSPNAGIAPRPLRETASGGELSRVMLALAGVGGRQGGRTIVFDEIDAGIGGKTALVVADRLRDASRDGQVIAITHLPQVASRADRHFAVAKDSESGVATATVTHLEDEQVILEVARMMGAGEDDEAATRHARELVSSGR
jgi:DNA repair protein RecN (Recombination protein N)